MMNILIIHGPNLNMLGIREPEIYGTLTLDDINHDILEYTKEKGFQVKFFQSNHEGAIIDFIHENYHWAHGIVINPGALTHYSYALRDAISSVGVPTVEVHLSDIQTRESFRKISVIAPACIRQISGLGKESYLRGVDALSERW
ncbi:type II 3-dehydroquinate dehydratase [candidate division KSB1 bacterium]|nr:type II 3-dehydroquinate dehydratase [candidate division KSB1 bacterium]